MKKGINNRPAKVQLLTPGTRARRFFASLPDLVRIINVFDVNVNEIRGMSCQQCRSGKRFPFFKFFC